MKHIFISHSWVTQLVTESIIKKENILLNDVIILNDGSRNFNYVIDPCLKPCLLTFDRVRNPPKVKVLTFKGIIKYVKWYARLLRGKFIINKIVKDNQFKLYTPQLNLYNYKLLSSHKNCLSFSFIEEGTLSYCRRDDINARFPIVRHPFIVKFFLSLDSCFKKAVRKETMDDAYDGAYKIMPFAFPDCKNVIDVSDDFKNLISAAPATEKVDNLLLLGNAFTEYKGMELEEYLIGFEKAMSYVNANTSKPIYYKHHPSVQASSRKEIKKTLSKLSDKFKELEDSVCTEFLMAKFQPTTYLFNSTLAIYAKEFNCKLVFLSKFIVKDTPTMNFGGIDYSEYYIEPTGK